MVNGSVYFIHFLLNALSMTVIERASRIQQGPSHSYKGVAGSNNRETLSGMKPCKVSTGHMWNRVEGKAKSGDRLLWKNNPDGIKDLLH